MIDTGPGNTSKMLCHGLDEQLHDLDDDPNELLLEPTLYASPGPNPSITPHIMALIIPILKRTKSAANINQASTNAWSQGYQQRDAGSPIHQQ